MADNRLPYRQGIHEALGVLAGQWVPTVLASLNLQPRTYSGLLEHINEMEERLGWVVHEKPLSQKVLTETLARMQRDGLLVKIERLNAFGNTWYQLTSTGRALQRALRPLAKWADAHRQGLIDARRAYRTGQSDNTSAQD